MIQDVKVVPLVFHVDDRGYLIEILRSTDEHFTRFGQVYLVGDSTRGTIRAFHKHARLWDWFFISHGSAKFVLRDDRPDSPTYNEMQIVVTGVAQSGLDRGAARRLPWVDGPGGRYPARQHRQRGLQPAEAG